ncbi:MAG TPA: hypothetical protein VN281_22205 [Verrucomicrobiae bacterium]|nr:hypothetical protein [Verrucomicrobiae bacterium]
MRERLIFLAGGLFGGDGLFLSLVGAVGFGLFCDDLFWFDFGDLSPMILVSSKG